MYMMRDTGDTDSVYWVTLTSGLWKLATACAAGEQLYCYSGATVLQVVFTDVQWPQLSVRLELPQKQSRGQKQALDCAE